jgi:general secretion pathway protein M
MTTTLVTTIMTPTRWTRILAMQRPGAVALYVGLIVLSVVVTGFALSTIAERRANIAAEENMLAQLEGHSLFARKDDGSPLGTSVTGSPFLQGQTVNVAGAALLQRVATAITRIGGNILSSQVDLQKADAKDGWIGLVVSCEIEQPSLQPLLYDLEAGMPFLFIDQLVAQGPAVPGTTPEGRLRVLISASGQWQGSK